MTNADSNVTLVLPVLNEIDGLRGILPLIDRSLFHEILMVDGGSTDGSYEFAQQNDITVFRQSRAGPSAAVYEAVQRVRTEFVIEFSPDGNSVAERLPALVSELQNGYDLVIVSRYLPPAKSADDTPLTAFGNWLFTTMTTVLLGHRITDCLVMFRGYRKNTIVTPEFLHYLKGETWDALITAWACVKRFKIHEIPGDEPVRLGSERKQGIFSNGFWILVMILRLFLYRLGLKT